IHTGVLDFILQQLVQLTAQLLHQLGHLTRGETQRQGSGSSQAQLCSSPNMAPPAPHLVRGSHKPYPPVIQRNDKVPLEQLDVHLAAPKQHQWVHGHHAAVPDEHAACLDLLVVHQLHSCA
ncbi:hypothetical protein Nmel_003647, partial [Mimus melanotis]